MLTRNRSNLILRFLIGIALIALFLPNAMASMRNTAAVNEWGWSSSKYWAICAETFRSEGAWLASRSGGKLIPAADVSRADDIGHNLLSGITSAVLGRSIVPPDVARLNVALCLLGFLVVLYMLMAARFWVAVLLLVLASKWLLPTQFASNATSPHASHSGVALLALVLPVVLALRIWTVMPVSLCDAIASPRCLLVRWRWIIWGLSSASLAVLVRSPFSFMLVFAVVGSGLVALWLRTGVRPRSFRASVVPILVLVISMLVVLLIPWTVLRLRDAMWKMEPSVCIETHGTSHNLIIGLGAVENKLGVTWIDSCGEALAKEVDPQAVYLTPRYYSALWKRYFQFWREQPGEVVRIYVEKSRVMLASVAYGWMPLWVVVFVTVSCAIVSMSRRCVSLAWGCPHSLVIFSASSMLGLFLLQGVCAHPSRQYWLPVESLFAVIVAVSVDLIVRWICFIINPEIAGTTRDSVIATDNFGVLTLKLLAVFCTVYPIVKLWGTAIT
jgi:hypothetical protein